MTSRARAYTAKQRTAALALVRAGSLITAASRATGVSRWTLLAWCRRAGVQTVPRLEHGPEVRAEVRALRKAGLTISAIHRATGVGRDTIALWTGPGRPGRPRSAAGPQVVGLRRAGVGICAAARLAGVAPATARRLAAERGL